MSFQICVGDTKGKKKYKQVFQKNMSKKGDPKIAENYTGPGYTQITFFPDLDKFGMKKLDKDIRELMTKRVFDVAGVTGKLSFP